MRMGAGRRRENGLVGKANLVMAPPDAHPPLSSVALTV